MRAVPWQTEPLREWPLTQRSERSILTTVRGPGDVNVERIIIGHGRVCLVLNDHYMGMKHITDIALFRLASAQSTGGYVKTSDQVWAGLLGL